MLRLKFYRKKSGLTQVELARVVGVSTSTIGMYEIGNREPSIELLSKLAIALEVSIDDLVDFRKIHDDIGQELLNKIKEIKEPRN